MAFQICPDTSLSACCPLSHLLRKCQLSQGESREAGANFLPLRTIQLVSPSGRDVAQRQRGLVSAGMAFQIYPDTNLSACLPSQSFASQMPALPRGEPRSRCEFLALTRSPNLSLPLGEMSRSDREGWNQLTWLFRFALTRTCLRVCPLSHLLRKCQLSQRESREAGANFLPYAQSKLVSPFGRDVAQRQRGLESAGMAFQIYPDTSFFVLRAKQKQSIFRYSVSLVGGGGFEPPKSLTTDLQSAPFGHSGNLPYSLAEIVELVDGLEPPTC